MNTIESVADLADIDYMIVNHVEPDHSGCLTRLVDLIKPKKIFYSAMAKAVIINDTMWKSTERMAYAVADGLNREGINVRVLNMKACYHSDVMAEVLDAKAVLFGSPTHNNGVLPLIADMFRYMEGLRPQGKIGAAFGSYGWSGESVKHLTKGLESMDMEVVGFLKVKSIPTQAALLQCVELGKSVGVATHEQLKDEE